MTIQRNQYSLYYDDAPPADVATAADAAKTQTWSPAVVLIYLFIRNAEERTKEWSEESLRSEGSSFNIQQTQSSKTDCLLQLLALLEYSRIRRLESRGGPRLCKSLSELKLSPTKHQKKQLAQDRKGKSSIDSVWLNWSPLRVIEIPDPQREPRVCRLVCWGIALAPLPLLLASGPLLESIDTSLGGKSLHTDLISIFLSHTFLLLLLPSTRQWQLWLNIYKTKESD